MRLVYALRNSIFSIASQVILVICGIIMQRALVTTLGNELNGLNSVFTNIISIISLSEMGVAAAIVYNLYKPIAQKDTKKIAQLMNLFKVIYRVIAVFVAVIGCAMTPFVHVFVKSGNFDAGFIRVVFLLFVANTALSYLFSYKRSLLAANQQAYILTIVDTVVRVAAMGANLAVLYVTQRIEIYLIVNIITTLTENITFSIIVDKKYPYAKSSEKPEKAVTKKVFADVKNIFIGKLSSTVLNSTDYVVISYFAGVVQSGFYFNYNIIINAISGLVNKILGGLQASIGDLFVENNHKKNMTVLRQLTFIFGWLALACSALLLCLLDTFVGGIWLGEEKLLPFYITAMCVLVFYVMCIRGPIWSMVSVSGLFAQDKYISLLGASSNLIISVLLGAPLGVFGVLIGTLVSQLLQYALKMSLFFGKFLHMSAKRYICDLAQYFAVFLTTTAASYYVCTFISLPNAWATLILRGLVALIIPNGVMIICFMRDQRFTEMLSLIKFYAGRMKNTGHAHDTDSDV